VQSDDIKKIVADLVVIGRSLSRISNFQDQGHQILNLAAAISLFSAEPPKEVFVVLLSKYAHGPLFVWANEVLAQDQANARNEYFIRSKLRERWVVVKAEVR
jgi:hypothetical protein